jgi:excisionase family DNA binding protein
MTVPEVAQALGISKATAYEAVKRGQIPTVDIGRRKVVPIPAFNKLLEGGK